MKKQLIIGLVGLSDSGKGEVVRILKQTEYNVKEIAFADALKDVCANMFKFNNWSNDTSPFHDKIWRERPFSELGGKTPRQILQQVGEASRSILDDVWVNHVRDKIVTNLCHSCDIHPKIIVISDIRYHNELQMLFDISSNYINEIVLDIWDIQRDVIPVKYQQLIKELIKYKNSTSIERNFTIADELSDIEWLKLRGVEVLFKQNNMSKYSHKSELNYWLLSDLANRHIDNNGTIKDLEEQIRLILNKLIK